MLVTGARRAVAGVAAAIATTGIVACGSGDKSSTSQQGGSTAATPSTSGRAPRSWTIKGGETRLRLNATTSKLLDAAGVHISPLGRATGGDGRFMFPVTGGNLTGDTLTGRVENAGGLRFAVAGARIDATDLVVRPGKGVVTAIVAGKRVPLLSMERGRVRRVPQSGSIVIPATAATLSPAAVPGLEDRLGNASFDGGLRLGRIQVSADS